MLILACTGWCGTTSDYCSTGCQTQFGICTKQPYSPSPPPEPSIDLCGPANGNAHCNNNMCCSHTGKRDLPSPISVLTTNHHTQATAAQQKTTASTPSGVNPPTAAATPTKHPSVSQHATSLVPKKEQFP